LTSGGGGEIRTLDKLLTYAGFQDRCIQPLCHPSGIGVNLTLIPVSVNWKYGLCPALKYLAFRAGLSMMKALIFGALSPYMT
jgi:hypothetical protein